MSADISRLSDAAETSVSTRNSWLFRPTALWVTKRCNTQTTHRREDPLGIGTSIFLIAVGAVLKYAVTAHVSGISVATVGVILMIAGAAGLALSLFWMTFYADRMRERRVVGDRV